MKHPDVNYWRQRVKDAERIIKILAEAGNLRAEKAEAALAELRAALAKPKEPKEPKEPTP